MNKYNIENLIEINQRFHHEHRVHPSDVEKANRFVQVIEATRNDQTPQAGDIVKYTNKYGEHYAKAHIEDTNEDGTLSVCEQPYVPFVFLAGKTVTTNTSGGAWCALPANMELVGKAQKAFIFWGSSGACANGAVTVFAEVNVWRYVDGSPEFSTENYDKFHVTIRENPDTYGYRYIVTQGATSHCAFRTYGEYCAWLDVYKGVERDSAWDPNAKTVWTYKQKTAYNVGEVVFATIQGIESLTMNNGSMQPCKRVYDGTTVTTYIKAA